MAVERTHMSENQVVLKVEAPKTRGKDGETGDDDKPDLSRAPVFADLEGEAKDILDHVILDRLAPVREGELGRFEAEVTSEEIYARCGGGKYRVIGKTKRGQPIKGAFVTLELAGEPILRSKLARRAYAQMIGSAEDSNGTNGANSGASLQEIIAMLEQTRTTAETERERRAEAEEARHKRELERLEAESKLRAAERAAEDDRRRKDEELRDERRRKDDDDRRRRDREEADAREARRRADDEAARQRDREHQVAMMRMLHQQPATDPTALLLAGVELASKLGQGSAGGDGSTGEPVTDLIRQLPQIIDKLKGTLGPAAAGAAGPGGEPLTIAGDLGEKGKRVVEHIRAQGYNPEQVLSQAFDAMMAIKAAPAAAQQQGGAAQASRRGPGGRPVTPAPAPAASAAPAAPPAQPTAPAAPAAPAAAAG